MNGFEEEVKSRSFGADGHVLIKPANGLFSDVETLKKQLSSDKDLLHIFEFTEDEAIVNVQGVHNVVRVRGVRLDDRELIGKLNSFSKFKGFDGLKRNSFKAIMGAELLDELGLKVGDSFKLFSPQVQFTPLGYFFRFREFEIIDNVRFNYKSLDSSIVFLNLGDTESFLGQVKPSKTLRLFYRKDIDIISKIKDLQVYNADVKTWKDENLSLHQALLLEKFIMFITLTLAIIIAVLNVTSVLIIGIISQRSTISILYVLGMEKSRIKKIFTIYGFLVGIMGLCLGIILGVFLSLGISEIVSFFERVFGFSVFPVDLYYINEVPAILEPSDLVLVAATSSLMLAVAVFVSSSLSKSLEISYVSKNE